MITPVGSPLSKWGNMPAGLFYTLSNLTFMSKNFVCIQYEGNPKLFFF